MDGAINCFELEEERVVGGGIGGAIRDDFEFEAVDAWVGGEEGGDVGGLGSGDGGDGGDEGYGAAA